MSEFSEMLYKHKLNLVLPLAGDLVYSSVGNKDTVICATISSGYIECDSAETCLLFLEYLKRVTKAKGVGRTDRVRCSKGIVYRQRVIFSKLLDIISISAKFNINIVVTDSFCVTNEQLKEVKDDIPSLKLYFSLQPSYIQKLGFTGWLTYSIVSQLVQFCRVNHVPILTAKNEDYLLSNGLWYRAPFLCGTCSRNRRRSSLLLLDESYYVVKDETGDIVSNLVDAPVCIYDNDEKQQFNAYRVKFESTVLFMYGFSIRNLLRDTKRGVI